MAEKEEDQMALKFGNNGNNEIAGSRFDDVIRGRGGNDDLEGNGGNDAIYGGSGHDELDGDSGRDSLYGGKGRDELDGGSGNDRLEGGSGNDRLDGGSGADRLWGGAGRDVFEFEVGDGRDIVEDFQDGLDRIDFDDFNFQSAAEVLSYADQVGDDVVFDFGTDGRLMLRSIDLSDLGAGDFIL